MELSHAMVLAPADNEQVALFDGKEAILNLIHSLSGIHVKQLEVLVTCQSNVVSPGENEETHVQRKHWIEGPLMETFGIDLRFDDGVNILPVDSARDSARRHPL